MTLLTSPGRTISVLPSEVQAIDLRRAIDYYEVTIYLRHRESYIQFRVPGIGPASEPPNQTETQLFQFIQGLKRGWPV